MAGSAVVTQAYFCLYNSMTRAPSGFRDVCLSRRGRKLNLQSIIVGGRGKQASDLCHTYGACMHAGTEWNGTEWNVPLGGWVADGADGSG